MEENLEQIDYQSISLLKEFNFKHEKRLPTKKSYFDQKEISNLPNSTIRIFLITERLLNCFLKEEIEPI